jgi:branched-chain amino acid aminotransferase
MTERLAYFCGQWISESQVSISLGDLGFTMGITVTERLRTFGGELFRKQAHLARMHESLAIIGLDAAGIVGELDSAIEQYLDLHRSQIGPGDDWAVVVFVTPGIGSGPTVCVHGLPLHFAEWADQFDEGVHAYLSEHRQVPPNCWPAELKCRSRMHYYLADQEARARRPRARAILLDQEGFAGEGSTANLVTYHRESGLATPRSTKVLPGVSVAVIAELAGQLGVPFAERDITVDELRAADEVWFTSTSICALPVVSIDDRPVGSGSPGTEYLRFLAAWSSLVGIDIRGQAQRARS